MGITFVMTGLMAIAFMGLQGINLADPTGKETKVEESAPFSDPTRDYPEQLLP